MRQLALLTIAAAALVAAAVAASAPNKGLCVGSDPGCYSTLQAAVDAAQNGDTIQVRAGTWAGGVTVTKSLTLTGAGKAVVSGGGPVITIGSASSAPTVTISNLTVTGGVQHGNPQSPSCGPDVPSCGPGYPTATALGGGIEAFPGTTVTISNSVVTGNVATPALSVPSVKARCPGDVPCPASFGDAAGIDNWGTMTIESSTVSDNHASAVQSNGGGIVAESGSSLTLRNSTVTGNTAAAVAPSGRFASGGGIFVDADATLLVENSSVSGNGASLANSLPHPYPNQSGDDDQANALGGGIQLADGVTAVIRNSHLDGNTITVDAPLGEPFGADAALCACGEVSLTLENSTLSGNSVTANVATTAHGGPSGPAALEGDSGMTVRNTRLTGNTITVTTPNGDAAALGAVAFFTDEPVTIANSSVSGNTATATSPGGSATVQGAGIANNGPLTLTNDQIRDNRGVANGVDGSAQGGGLWNGELFGPPDSSIALVSTTVTGNSLSGGAGVTREGGGVYTVGFPTTLANSRIAGNAPDDCAGC
jgi:hypothetical protein